MECMNNFILNMECINIHLTRSSQEPVIAHLVFNLTSTFFGNISDNSFFGSFNEIFTTGNASHL